MIVACYQRTMAGAAQRAAQRGIKLGEAIPSPKPLPKPVEAPETPSEPIQAQPMILGDVVIAFPTRYREHKHIIDLMARMHGATYEAVMGSRLFRSITLARMAAICAVKEWENQHDRVMTLPQLGRIFGGRDHTTILHSFRTRGYHEKR